MPAYTVAEAATALCVQPGTIHKWIRLGRLAAIPARNARGGSRWLVTDLTVVAPTTPQHCRDDAFDTNLAHAEIDLALPEWRDADDWASGRAARAPT